MAPPDDKSGEAPRETERKRGQRHTRARRRPPPEGETLDTLLDGAARACRERGRDGLSQALQRRTKKDEE